MTRKNISVLGVTGSIGRSTVDVIRMHPEKFRIVAMTANSNWRELARLAKEFRPLCVAVADPSNAKDLEDNLRSHGVDAEVLSGPKGIVDAATLSDADTVMAAIVGGAGLQSTIAAAAAGKRILLANKEALVMAGAIFMSAINAGGATLLPIDSEHNAIFQCLPAKGQEGDGDRGLRRILLTGSGGPFRTKERSELQAITPDQACAHPNWVMGRKISVDSATMMNKGLEIIEAHWLFEVPASMIEVVVHPQSVIHSMVEYLDGSVVAQLGNPDMRTPIAQALAYPSRIESGVQRLDIHKLGALTFEPPDFDRFPALRMAYAALSAGGTAPAILNAANEVAVGAFLSGQLPFLAITDVLEHTLDSLPARPVTSIEDINATDLEARAIANRFAVSHSGMNA